MTFLRSFRSGNDLYFAHEYGPIANEPLTIPEEFALDIGSELEIAQDLAVIQNHTSIQIGYPDLLTVTGREAGQWRRATRLLQGETVTWNWRKFEFNVEDESGINEFPTNDQGVQLLFIEPLTVRVSSEKIQLGHTLVHIHAARLDPHTPLTRRGATVLVPVIPSLASSSAEIRLLSDEESTVAVQNNLVGLG